MCGSLVIFIHVCLFFGGTKKGLVLSFNVVFCSFSRKKKEIIMSLAFELFFFSYFSLILTFFCKNWLNYAMVRISLGVYSISFSSLTCLKVRNSSFYQAGNYSNPLIFERKRERETDRREERLADCPY